MMSPLVDDSLCFQTSGWRVLSWRVLQLVAKAKDPHKGKNARPWQPLTCAASPFSMLACVIRWMQEREKGLILVHDSPNLQYDCRCCVYHVKLHRDCNSRFFVAPPVGVLERCTDGRSASVKLFSIICNLGWYFMNMYRTPKAATQQHKHQRCGSHLSR